MTAMMPPRDGAAANDNELADAKARTDRAQARASDPTVSAWVAANAGTGKTHVLTLRVLRLLLAGTKPERILCLTYTKAAAAEMSTRVFDVLATWVTAGAGDLDRKLTTILGRPPIDGERMLARQLFAMAIETPGGLKVQTIHAFCERLLQRFPLEAGVAPGFTILDEATTAALRRESIDEVLTRATSGRDAPLADALRTTIAYAAEESFDEKLAEIMQRREVLESMLVGDAGASSEANDADSDSPFGADFAFAERTLRRSLGLAPGEDRAGLEAAMAALLSHDELVRVRDVLASGSTSAVAFSAIAAQAVSASSPAARVEAITALLLTKEGEPRQRLLTNGLKADHPDVDALLLRAQAACTELARQRMALEILAATLALLRLADAVMTGYRAAKERRAALDFEDLIVSTARLLGTAESASWVLYKLDGGLDHVLIDESQDTSPLQWTVVRALVDEFFAGAGAHDGVRTVFAVGDEKQSIYSFQGAAPEMFAASGTMFADRAGVAGHAFETIALFLSFRTVAPVLAAVDRVFADRTRTPGLGTSGNAIAHASSRHGHAGRVEIWPTEVWEESEPADAWTPLDDHAALPPVVKLAERIADTIAAWLRDGEVLASEGRPIRPADILILVGRRQPFAQPMITALKARKIAVAGADRIRIAEQIAVEDLMSLGDFVLLPDDDLALAEVLKSPLIGFDDDDLLKIAADRRGTLWRALLETADHDARFREAAQQLKRWRGRADLAPPFEFYASLLDRDGGRRRLLDRLGPDAADPIDEFLSLALAYDDAAAPSLVGFLDWLRQSEREIKRDMEHGRDEVRIMTVHGAKGLEAPIVFLPDTCAPPAGRAAGILEMPATGARPPVSKLVAWPIKGAGRHPVIAEARRRHNARQTEERNRLLYVAMTRARDRLYIAGFEGRKARPRDCWYDIMREQLAPGMQAIEIDGRTVLRSEAPQTRQAEASRHAIIATAADEPLPDWALRAAPRERQLSIPMAPSQFVPYEIDEDGDPVEPAATSAIRRSEAATREPAEPAPRVLAADNRFLRGNLTHALLEHLPQFAPDRWPQAAEAFVARRGRDLSARQRASIVAETLAVLQGANFAFLFGPDARAEVPIVTEIANPRRGGPPLVINGQIDRLARIGDTVMIVDYKTNRPPPQALDGIADAYLFQLAAYRLGIQRIFPGHGVRAAILWTETPRIMEIPQSILDEYQSRIWELEALSLDAAMAAP